MYFRISHIQICSRIDIESKLVQEKHFKNFLIFDSMVPITNLLIENDMGRHNEFKIIDLYIQKRHKVSVMWKTLK